MFVYEVKGKIAEEREIQKKHHQSGVVWNICMLIFSNVLMFILGFPIHFQMNLCKYLRRSQFHYIEFWGEDNSTISPQMMMMMRTTSKMRMRMVTCRSNTKANRKDLLRKLCRINSVILCQERKTFVHRQKRPSCDQKCLWIDDILCGVFIYCGLSFSCPSDFRIMVIFEYIITCMGCLLYYPGGHSIIDRSII